MQSLLGKTLLLCALAAAVSSCASNGETRLRLPPADDLRPAAEPAYPEAALTSEAVELAWWNSVLAWGRGEQAKVKRICEWADVLGAKYKQELPADWCEPKELTE